ncbi:MAG: molybdate ABC transporter substrate-binding protein [Pseudomonadota bacterium]
MAVASNFLPVAEQLAADFERETEHDITLSHGSTGQAFALIANGAPFDIFLAADRERPDRLLAEGLATEVRTYAIGRLVLVSRRRIDENDPQSSFVGESVSLADPMLAPYGKAATAAMEGLNLDTATFQPLPVGNVGQAATLFSTGNADLAFVSASLLPLLNAPHELPLDGLHPPIEQGAALLRRAEGNEAVLAFWEFLFSETSRPRIRAGGYDLPE